MVFHYKHHTKIEYCQHFTTHHTATPYFANRDISTCGHIPSQARCYHEMFRDSTCRWTSEPTCQLTQRLWTQVFEDVTPCLRVSGSCCFKCSKGLNISSNDSASNTTSHPSRPYSSAMSKTTSNPTQYDSLSKELTWLHTAQLTC